MKNNLSYYFHDTGSVSHWKLKALRREYTKQFGVDGWAGEGRFWALNCFIAAADGCKYPLHDEERKFQLAEDLGYSPEELDTFLSICLNKAKLIYIVDGCLMTRRTQEKLMAANEERQKNSKYKRDERLRKEAMSTLTNGNVSPDNSMSSLKNGESSPDLQQTYTHTYTHTNTNSKPPTPLTPKNEGVGDNGKASSANGRKPDGGSRKEKVAQKRKDEPIPFWNEVKLAFEETYQLVKGRTYAWPAGQGNQNNGGLSDIIFTLKGEVERHGGEWIGETAYVEAKSFFAKAASVEWVRKNYSVKNVAMKINEVLAICHHGVNGTEIIQQHSHLFDASKKIYLDWYTKRNGVQPIVKEKDDEALRLLIPQLRARSDSDEEYLKGWNLIFCQWDKLEPFLRDKMDLRDIYVNINKIIQQLKNGKNANGHSTSKNGFHDQRERFANFSREDAYAAVDSVLGGRKTG